jgi:hypothetical protein
LKQAMVAITASSVPCWEINDLLIKQFNN